MKLKWDTVVTATLVICAVITTGLVIRRELAPSNAVMPAPAVKPVFLPNWRSHLAQGMRIGSSSDQVQLIEFSDFECPFCADFHKTLKRLREKYPNQASLSYIHLPLAMHRFAMPAARVAECAGEQGGFESMHDYLFEAQDSLGLKPWSEYATRAGVPDLKAFETCIASTAAVPRIEAGKALGERLGINATPTLIINGWKRATRMKTRLFSVFSAALKMGAGPPGSVSKHRSQTAPVRLWFKRSWS